MVIEIGELLHDVLCDVVRFFPGTYVLGAFFKMIGEVWRG